MTNQHETPIPAADLQALDRLIGTWKITGDAKGTVTYEWMEGHFFLLQHVELEQGGQRTVGLEVIGHLHPFGEEPSRDIKSRYYDNLGNTLDYTYEFDGDTLTIWGGEKDSPAHFKGTFNQDGTAMTGDWVYPGGGGYSSTMTRVKGHDAYRH